MRGDEGYSMTLLDDDCSVQKLQASTVWMAAPCGSLASCAVLSSGVLCLF